MNRAGELCNSILNIYQPVPGARACDLAGKRKPPRPLTTPLRTFAALNLLLQASGRLKTPVRTFAKLTGINDDGHTYAEGLG